MKRYLIVEDEAGSRWILLNYFSKFASCDTAENGSEGIKLFEKAICDGNPYHLVCTDINMPVLDGYGLIQKIRECEGRNNGEDFPRTIIFVISARDSSADMAHALLDCDCDDYIVKPLHRDQLKALLKKYNFI